LTEEGDDLVPFPFDIPFKLTTTDGKVVKETLD
jgi:hypothetical protein